MSEATLGPLTELCETELPIRAYSRLTRIGIRTLGQASELTRAQLLTMRGIGETSVGQIVALLHSADLDLRRDPPPKIRGRQGRFSEEVRDEMVRLREEGMTLAALARRYEASPEGIAYLVRQTTRRKETECPSND